MKAKYPGKRLTACLILDRCTAHFAPFLPSIVFPPQPPFHKPVSDAPTPAPQSNHHASAFLDDDGDDSDDYAPGADDDDDDDDEGEGEDGNEGEDDNSMEVKEEGDDPGEGRRRKNPEEYAKIIAGITTLLRGHDVVLFYLPPRSRSALTPVSLFRLWVASSSLCPFRPFADPCLSAC